MTWKSMKWMCPKFTYHAHHSALVHSIYHQSSHAKSKMKAQPSSREKFESQRKMHVQTIWYIDPCRNTIGARCGDKNHVNKNHDFKIPTNDTPKTLYLHIAHI